MSAQAVWEQGGAWENNCVAEAIEARATGRSSISQKGPDQIITLLIQGTNLAPGTYRVIVDTDGNMPGPPELRLFLGTVIPDADGHIKYTTAWPQGTFTGEHTWKVELVLDLSAPGGCEEPGRYSILKTDTNLEFALTSNDV